MDIILLENIEKVGFKDEIVSVKNGYGRNFLIPQGKAFILAYQIFCQSFRRKTTTTSLKKKKKLLQMLTLPQKHSKV